jgi:hypothetical protein
MRTMPGLSSNAAAEHIDIDENGDIVGLHWPIARVRRSRTRTAAAGPQPTFRTFRPLLRPLCADMYIQKVSKVAFLRRVWLGG